MSQPFVVSYKLVGDTTGGVVPIVDMRQALAQLDGAMLQSGGSSQALVGAVLAQEQAMAVATNATRVDTAALQANAHASRLLSMQRTNLLFQLNDIGVSLASGMPLAMVFIQQGSQIATIWGAEEGGIGRALRETGNMAVTAATKFGPLLAVIALGALAIGGLTAAINENQEKQVSWGDVTLAIFQSMADGLQAVFKPQIDAVADWWDDAWVRIKDNAKAQINGLVGSFLIGIENIKYGIAVLPDYFTIAAEGAANNFLKGIAFMTIGVVGHLNNIIDVLNLLGGNITKIDPMIGMKPIKLGGDAAQANIDALTQGRNEAVAGIVGTDYAGDWFNNIRDNATENYDNRQDKKKGGKGDRESEYERLIKSTRERTAAAELEMKVIGLSAFATEKMRKQIELENAAKKDAIGLSPARVAEIEREANAFAQVTSALERQQEAWSSWQSAGESAIDGVVDGLAEGKVDIDSILKDISKTLLQMTVSNPLKNMLLGTNYGTIGDLGGMISGLLGGGAANTNAVANGIAAAGSGDISGWASLAGNARGTNYWRGGETRAHEEGGEIIDLPTGTRIYPHDVSMAMAKASGGGSGSTQINVNNYSGAQVGVTEEDDGRGGRRFNIQLEEAQAAGISRAGSPVRRAMAGTYGLRQSVRRR